MLISTAENDLGNIQNLVIDDTSNDRIIISVLGKTIIIEFSMVYHDNYPVGQITAKLIKNLGSSLESEHILLSAWYDDLGNVSSPTIDKNSTYNLGHNNYLKTFTYQIIHSLMLSNHMKPCVNNE